MFIITDILRLTAELFRHPAVSCNCHSMAAAQDSGKIPAHFSTSDVLKSVACNIA